MPGMQVGIHGNGVHGNVHHGVPANAHMNVNMGMPGMHVDAHHGG